MTDAGVLRFLKIEKTKRKKLLPGEGGEGGGREWKKHSQVLRTFVRLDVQIIYPFQNPLLSIGTRHERIKKIIVFRILWEKH